MNSSEKRWQEKLVALTEARNTLGLIAEEYIERREGNEAARATLNKTKRLLNDLTASLAKRPIREITAAEILVLKAMDESL